MATAEAVIELIRRAFASTERPPDAYLTNSRDGCEPEESVAPFRGLEWSGLEPAMLDANYTALSFFSEGAFRYFVPAFMIADVRQELRTADPTFHLTHGLTGFESTIEVGGRSWVRRHGGDTLLNPRRYGAVTWSDHARFRLSAFSREESAAIVAYLRWRRASDELDAREIDAALEGFWLERAQRAPKSAELAAHVAEELAFMEAWRRIRPQQSE